MSSFKHGWRSTIGTVFLAVEAIRIVSELGIIKAISGALNLWQIYEFSAIKKFLMSYQQAHTNLFLFQKDAGIDPNYRGKMSEWLESDRKAMDAFRDLKSSPFSSSLDGIDDSVMASRTTKFDELLRQNNSNPARWGE